MGNTVPLLGEVWMPWKECSVVDERLRFVAQLLDGEAMSEVCRAFGISRKTGDKIFERYKEHGLEALTDRSRRLVRYANQAPRQIESLIVAAKREQVSLGARKIRELLVRRQDGDIRVPAKSTIHAVLHRHGLVKIPGRRGTGRPARRCRPARRQTTSGAPISRACLREGGGRVQARQWPILLSADCHRPRLALSPALRSP
jgi:transposase